MVLDSFEKISYIYKRGTEEFQKMYPKVPHSNYWKYVNTIKSLNDRCKIIDYGKYQNQLTQYLENDIEKHFQLGHKATDIIEGEYTYLGLNGISTRGSARSLLYYFLEVCSDEYQEKDIPEESSYVFTNNIVARRANHYDIQRLYSAVWKIVSSIVSQSDYRICIVCHRKVLEYKKDFIAGLRTDLTNRLGKRILTKVKIITKAEFDMTADYRDRFIFVSLYRSKAGILRDFQKNADALIKYVEVALYYKLSVQQIFELPEIKQKRRRLEAKIQAQEYRYLYPLATSRLQEEWNHSGANYEVSEDEYLCQNAKRLTRLEYLLEEQKESDRREAERQRKERVRQEEKRRDEEIVRTLLECVESWNVHSTGSLKHKYFFDYYPYRDYKDSATSSMRSTWSLVWHFKNDPNAQVRVTATQHAEALNTAVRLVTQELKSAFGDKTKYLTLVCLTASTQHKTNIRFKEFAKRVCASLGMDDAFCHIRVTEGADAKHLGGSGNATKTYDQGYFFNRRVILFDDVRTSGQSIDTERETLEKMGAKVIGVITLAQTKW